jgi:hypothetical protein
VYQPLSWVKNKKKRVRLCHIIGMVAFVRYIINYEKDVKKKTKDRKIELASIQQFTK